MLWRSNLRNIPTSRARSGGKCRAAGVNFPSNMLYAHALETAGELYGVQAYAGKAERLRERIRRLSFNGTFFEDNAIRNRKGELVLAGHLSEACQYYAFYFKTATKEEYGALYRLLKEKFGPNRTAEVYPQVVRSNAIVGDTLRLLYFLQNGERELVFSESLEYFYKMAERTGTLWEHDSPHDSLNHGFASIAANILLDCYCGFGGFDAESGEPVLSEPVADSFSLIAPNEGGKSENRSQSRQNGGFSCLKGVYKIPPIGVRAKAALNGVRTCACGAPFIGTGSADRLKFVAAPRAFICRGIKPAPLAQKTREVRALPRLFRFMKPLS